MTIDIIAAELLAAQANAVVITPPAQSNPAFDLENGYAVGAAVAAARRARGERTIGRKIGFTNAAIWEQYGVGGPLWAHIYDTTVIHAGGEDVTYTPSGLTAPQIEPELVLGLAAAPSPTALNATALLDCVAWVALGFEIVDCHFADWRFTLADAVADFGLHAALIVGPQLPISSFAPAGILDALARCSLTLRCDGQLIATGMGANALGSPLMALGHLVRTLTLQEAEPLAAGEIVTTGTLTPAFPLIAGQTWTATLKGLGEDVRSLHLRVDVRS
ncbi:MAG: hypothetical protein HC822_15210 [Oscillochloris sp.]|nr:hypothetical protein [Oscillochloris sp.]